MRWRTALARLGVTGPGGRDAVAAGLAAVLLAGGTLLVAALVGARQQTPTPVDPVALVASMLLTVAGCATIAVRRRWPRTAVATGTALVLACAGLDVIATGPAIGLVVCAYTAATLLSARHTATVLGTLAVVHAGGGVLAARLGGDVRGLPTFWGAPGQDLDAMLVATAATYGIPAAIGAVVRRRRARLAALTDRAERLEVEREARDREAAALERKRIARELHDIAAHDLSAIVVQAGAADRLVDGDPDAAKAVLRSIRGQGRQTLAAMRQLVGVMRDDDTGGRAPQPSLARVDELLATARGAGMAVRLTVVGTPKPLPVQVDLAAYRVVQEALTNARRHAPGAPVTVHIAHGDGVRLIVHNGPGPLPVAQTGVGHGLAGMRERVRQVGGTIATGPADDGGWRVAVELPR
jgi:signal transduction histidine kinase